jgi:hypothetical protein
MHPSASCGCIAIPPGHYHHNEAIAPGSLNPLDMTALLTERYWVWMRNVQDVTDGWDDGWGAVEHLLVQPTGDTTLEASLREEAVSQHSGIPMSHQPSTESGGPPSSTCEMPEVMLRGKTCSAIGQ